MTITNHLMIEGMDGAGKGGLSRRLLAHYRLMYGESNVLIVREPGGTPMGEEVRDLMKYGYRGDKPSDRTRLLGMYLSRYHLNETVILPALEAGKMVIHDRGDPSSFAYQVFGHGERRLRLFKELIAGGDEIPYRTLFLDVGYKTSLARRDKRDCMDDIETENNSEEKFNHIRAGYRHYFDNYLADVHIIDTNALTEEEVFEQALVALGLTKQSPIAAAG